MLNTRIFHLLKTSWLVWRLRQAKTSQTREIAHRALSDQLANGRGLPMKIGQVLAGMQDDSAYQPLTQSVEPWKLKDMKPVLEAAWQCDLHEVISSIDESAAAASLGQVHRATLKNGREVAIKVQYPDIAAAINSEMHLAGLMPRGGPVKRWDFNLDAYKSTLKTNMLHELDYLHEMRQQQEFHQRVHVQGLHIPRTFPELCHSNVLVQTWSSGARLSEACSWSNLKRLQLSKILMQTMFQCIFEAGLVHGDPHPGNLLFQQGDEQASVTLLDFGCTINIDEPRRLALLQLILASRGECNISPLHGFTMLGFDHYKLSLIEEKLPKLMQILFRPFTEERPFDPKFWHPGQESEKLLGDNRWLFRAAGPADLFLLMRVFQGLVQQLSLLNTKLPWWPILLQSIQPETIKQAKAVALQHGATDEHSMQVESFGSAKQFHIRVCEGDKEIAHITLPATAALELSSLIPESAAEVIAQKQIDVKKIETDLARQGLEPQSLLDIHNQEKHYQLWLE